MPPTLKMLKMFSRSQACLDSCGYTASVLVYHAAATISRLKPASLLQLSNQDNRLCHNTPEIFDKISNCLQIDITVMRSNNLGSLIMVYHKDMLDKLLDNEESQRFLKDFSYSKCLDSDDIIKQLKEKFKSKKFPHEIGLLLGYPINDIKGFIENKGCAEKTLGYWKVYDDVDYAEKTFRKFRQCQIRAVRMFTRGTDIMDIGVKLRQRQAG